MSTFHWEVERLEESGRGALEHIINRLFPLFIWYGQQAERFKTCIAETLTIHFAVLAEVVKEHNLHTWDIYNLNEVGASAVKDIAGRSRRKEYISRQSRSDASAQRFANFPLVTMMPVIAVDVSAVTIWIVFWASHIPFRHVVANGITKIDWYQEWLPRGALVKVRQNIVSVDSTNFSFSALRFVRLFKDWHGLNSKVLLVFDGYRSHMSLEVHELFKSNEIIAYALPSQTGGKTQHFDTALFGTFKQALNQFFRASMDPERDGVWPTYDFCSILKTAYDNSFTPSNIRSSYRCVAIYPTDLARFLSMPLHAAAECPSEIETVMQMKLMMQGNHCQFPSPTSGLDPQIGSSELIDTQNCSVLTSVLVMQLMSQRSEEIDWK